MSIWEGTFFWVSIGCYVLVCIGYLVEFVFQKDKLELTTKVILWIGFLANIETIVARTLTSGQLPVRTMYELNLVVAVLTVGVFIFARRFFPKTELIGIFSVSFAFLIMGWGYVDSTEILTLTPAYKSNWLVVHVLFGLLSTACYVFAAGTSLFYILRIRYTEGLEPPRHQMLPGIRVLEEMFTRFTLFGFLSATIMLISGAIWAKLLWGQYWSWDPVETWSLLSWLIYGIFLHLRFTYGWTGKKLAILNLICLVSNIVSSWAVGLVTPNTYHSLDEITRPID